MEATYNSTSPVEEIAGLRQYRGLTVRALQPHGRRSKFTPRGRSKQICRSRVSHHSKNMTSARQAKQSSYRGDWVTEDQLPSKLIQTNSCDDAVTRSDDLHYYNCFKKQSLLSLLSLPRLSSGSCKSRPLMLSTSRPRMTTLTILIVLLLSQLSFCLAGITYDAKHPLTRTDGSSNVYRTFTGDGPVGSTHIARYGNSVSPRSFLPDTTSSDSGPLDFQTMRVIPGWGPHNTDVLLVSGRDYIYMLNATGSTKDGEIRYIQRLQWKSPNATQKSCQRMGKDESECNNFIRVVERWDDNRLYVCGTNSYEPTCRFYSRDDFNAPANKNSLVFEEASCNPRCVVPYNPNTASASLYTRTSNEFQLFSAVINDFMGKKPVLMRKSDPYVYSMDKWFNDPTFIKMVEYKDGKVYLFFRETATSVETGTDESVTYARVAQVCKNDIGGLSILPGQWTTFLKARLKCSSNANKGFVFNNLTSVSNITTITNQYGSMDVIFATFTTPWEWNTVSTSAVCVFSMDTIRTTFEGNFLKDQEYRPISNMEDHHPSENIIKAVPIPDMEVPRPRPGRCLNDSSLMTDDSLSFAKTYFLMYEPVNPLYEKAMFVSETDVRATQIAIDTNAGDNNELLVYVGTEEGKVLRLRPRLNETTGPKSILLEEMQIANKSKCDNGEISCGILALHISRPELDQRVENNLLHPDEEQIVPAVFVAFTDRMTQVPLTSCKQYANERCCNADPECGWYREQRCVVRTPFVSLSAVSSLSEIPTDCQLPSSATDVLVVGVTDSVPRNATEELATAGITDYVAAALVGFVVGVLLVMFVMLLVLRHRRHHAKQNITIDKGRYASESYLDKAPEAVAANQKQEVDYFDISRASVCFYATSTERPTSLIHEIQTDRNRPYSPLTPLSIDEEVFPTMEEALPDISLPERKLLEVEMSIPLLDQTHEAVLDDDTSPLHPSFLQTNLVEKKHESVHTENEAPPELPPKQSSLRKFSAELPTTLPLSRNSSNNNNTLSDARKPARPPPPSSPPPPSTPDDDLNGATVISEKPVISRSLPPRKPPPPRPKMGLRKHETFSGSHGQKVKPPVPPKSNLVMRSASMRAPSNICITSDLHSLARDDLSPTCSTLPRDGPLFSSRVARSPSYKHNTAATRSKSKGLVAVAPPVIPASE
ncbi:uncharacterized protein LOC143445033 isoform X4 [Clavelina lepadiformis]|uniref:uncharacterized protein LOC143445033 isoform X4 n=1 Tax=Clavelina lepadiformis TaxID=159417 RepID=UPI0040438D96